MHYSIKYYEFLKKWKKKDLYFLMLFQTKKNSGFDSFFKALLSALTLKLFTTLY